MSCGFLAAGAILAVLDQAHCRFRDRHGADRRAKGKSTMKKVLAALAPLTFTLGLLAAATPAYAVNNHHPLETQGAPNSGGSSDGVCQDGQTMHTEGDYDHDGDGVKETHVTNDYECQGGQWVLVHSHMTIVRFGPGTVRPRK